MLSVDWRICLLVRRMLDCGKIRLEYDFSRNIYRIQYDKSILVNAGTAAFTWILLGGFLSVPAALPEVQ